MIHQVQYKLYQLNDNIFKHEVNENNKPTNRNFIKELCNVLRMVGFGIVLEWKSDFIHLHARYIVSILRIMVNERNCLGRVSSLKTILQNK